MTHLQPPDPATIRAEAAFAAPDDIRTFCGDIDGDEYEQRRRIKVLRNAACYKVTQTNCAEALALCWMVTETASAWIYAPASVEELSEIAQYLRRLMTVADQAQAIGSWQ